MEEDMMMPNVAPAPMMVGTPMGGDLSAPMAPAQAELSPAEMQEAQGALMQIIQIIQMLVNQGMSEAEIQQFLAQYGITEEELDQAAPAERTQTSFQKVSRRSLHDRWCQIDALVCRRTMSSGEVPDFSKRRRGDERKS